MSVAASLAVGLGVKAGVAISGAGAWASNTILTDTKAYIANSEVESFTFVDIEASNIASVDATIVAATLAAAGGGAAGIGASIGVSIAQNKIGTAADPSQVLAYIEDSTVNAKAGALTIDASGDQVINAVVVAASVAVAGAGKVGVGISGAGAAADNLIAQHVKAYIDGDDNNANATVRGIHANSISILAHDSSLITATAVGASLAASFAGKAAISLSIGVSVARNEIRSVIEASIQNASNVEARSGDIVINAGASDDSSDASATYTGGTQALKKGDTVKSGDQIYRFLGEGEKVRPTYESSAGEVYLKEGDTVKLLEDHNDGGDVGAIYRYVGDSLQAPAGENEGDDPIDLAGVNYSTDDDWEKSPSTPSTIPPPAKSISSPTTSSR